MEFNRVVLGLVQAFVVLFAVPVWASGSNMIDRLPTTGEGRANPNHGQRIKNIMMFLSDGWEGLISEWNPSDLNNGNPTWPLHFGKRGYLTKSPSVFLWQMHEIKELGGTTAIAHLILPDVEAAASGKGACWNGDYVGRDASNNRACSAGGTWRFPKAFHPDVGWAAWMKGVQVAPQFSINNYEFQTERHLHAADAVRKLKELVEWYRQTVPAGDLVSLRTTSGQLVVLTEGLPENTGLSSNAAARADLCAYMKGRTDIFWIDNLLNADDNSCGASNIFRSAAASDAAQQHLRGVFGSRYLYTYGSRVVTKRISQAIDSRNHIPISIQRKWLNIDPSSNGTRQPYPVLLSQWNEYGEFLMFEPNEMEDYGGYYRLKSLLQQQP
ncbi:MAG TPA: hypothetical protein VE153_13360 [Myxococcus sp.]|nr:hypothetical protein [Myxococcus sp.]